MGAASALFTSAPKTTGPRPWAGPSRVKPLDRTMELAGIGLVAGLLVAAGVILVVFWNAPLTFSLVLHSSGWPHADVQNLTFPKDYLVSGSWVTSEGTPAVFEIMTLGGFVVYYSDGRPSGSFSFTASFSTYDFVLGSVTLDYQSLTTWVNGTYTAPL